MKDRIVRRLAPWFRRVVLSRLRWQLLHQPVIYGDPARVTVDPTAKVMDALFNTFSGTITVGPYVLFGQGVSVFAASHNYRLTGLERQAALTEGFDIVIEEGAWLASNVTVVGPCTIGAHSVVAAGSVVTKDVPYRTLVAGNPACAVRKL